MDTTSLHGLTGSVQAGIGPAPAKPPGNVGILGTGIPNIFDPAFWGAFGTKQTKEGKRAGLPGEAGSTVEGAQAVAKAVGHPGGWAKHFVQLVEAYGLRLLQLIAGGALVLFGLVTLAKGSTPRLGAVG